MSSEKRMRFLSRPINFKKNDSMVTAEKDHTSPYVYVGYYCNNNCIFCSESDESFLQGLGGGFAEKEKVKSDIRKIRELYDFINFMGREPTMRKDIGELVAYAKSLGFRQVGISTNGRMFSYEPFAKKMLDSGLNQIGISFYSHKEKVFDEQSQVDGSFKQAVSAIKNIILLKSDDTSLLINIPLNKKNADDLQGTVELLLDLGVREINILWVAPLSRRSMSKEIVGRMGELGDYAAGIAVKYGGKAKFWLNEFLPCSLRAEYRQLFFNCLEKNPLKKRIALCESCPYASKCDGVLSTYIDLYGSEEFKLD